MHSFLSVHPYMNSSIYSFFIRSFVHSRFFQSSIYSFVRSFVHSFIYFLILLRVKFLQFDWLREVVFQLNLKYLHVKITNLLRVVV